VVGTPGENAREITVLCYLNKEWKTEWGGQLRCHPHAEITDQVSWLSLSRLIVPEICCASLLTPKVFDIFVYVLNVHYALLVRLVSIHAQ
jgi:hypothetical protein